MSDVGTPLTSSPVYVDRRTTDNTDSLSYDNGETRYDYDLARGGPHDDISGRAGYGYTHDNHDVYVSGSFDEATGDIAGAVSTEHVIDDDTTLRSSGSINNKGETAYSVGGTHDLGENGRVDVEFGEDKRRGEYLEGDWSRVTENGSDNVHYSASENGGASVTYDGQRRGDDWQVDTSLKADDKGEITGSISGHQDLQIDENTTGRLSGNVDLEGNWIAAGDFTHSLSDEENLTHGMRFDSKDNAEIYVGHNNGANSERVTLTHVADRDETTLGYTGHHEGENWRTDESVTIGPDGKVEGQVTAEYRRELSENAVATVGGTARLDGTWDANAGVEHLVDENIGMRHSVRINSKGETEIAPREAMWYQMGRF